MKFLKGKCFALRPVTVVSVRTIVFSYILSIPLLKECSIPKYLSPDYIYVFEFKLYGTAEEALKQIDEKGYLLPYTVDGRKLVKVGVSFDAEKRNLGEWLIG